jgi:hypothetical protein
VLAICFFAKTFRIRLWYGKAKSNSLLYLYNADTGKANWATYDKNLDSWTKGYLGENPKDAADLNEYPLFSKYNSGFTYTATEKNLATPTIAFLRSYRRK